MNRRNLIGCAVGVFLLSGIGMQPLGAQGETEEEPGGPRAAGGPRVVQARLPSGDQRRIAAEDLSDHWFRYRNYLANDLNEQAATELSDLVALQKQTMIPRATEIAEAMVFEGYLYSARGDLAKARVLFGAAIVMDRYQSEAYAALARAEIRSNRLAVWQYVKNNLLSVWYSTVSFWDRFTLAANMLLVLGLALAVAFVLFAALMVRKHGALLYHDLQESNAGARGRESASRLLLALVLAAPLLLFFGVWWVACYWIALMWVYMTGKERVIGSGMLLFAILLPVGMSGYRILYTSYRDPSVQILVASRSPSDPKRLTDLMTSHLSQHPDDLDVQFVLGNMYGTAGRYEEALDVYKRIVDRSPAYQIALVNMGNIFFHLRDYENAIKYYLQALQADGNSALINYNTKAAYSERFDFSKADQYMRAAQEIDPAATARYQSASAMKVVDETFSVRKIAWRMLSGRTSAGLERDPPLIREILHRPEFVAVTSSIYYPVLAAILVGAIIYSLVRKRSGGSLALCCAKCGRAFCKKCQRGVGRDRYCSQCAHIFIVKNGISEEARTRKFSEIQKFNAYGGRQLLIMSLLLPGSEKLLGEKPLRGFLSIVVWLSLLGGVLAESVFFKRSVPFSTHAGQFATALLIAVVVLYYAAYNIRNIINPTRLQS